MKKSFFVLFMCLLCSSQVAVNAQSSQKTDALMVRDTRDVNEPPSFFKQEIRADLKTLATAGISTAYGFSTNLTISPWPDASAGYIHQLNFNNNGVFYRNGDASKTSWNVWNKLVLCDLDGNIEVAGHPANQNEESLISYILSNKGVNGQPHRWKMMTASYAGYKGVKSNGYEIWEYPADVSQDDCCKRRFAIQTCRGESSHSCVIIGPKGGLNIGYPSYYEATDLNDLSVNGNVGIGTSDTQGYKLAVNGTIRAKEVKVESEWADFVFKKDYNLPALEEVEQHIEENGTLPGVPSEKEVKANGVNLAETNVLLLQKIEELTLYIIQQEKRMEVMVAKIDSMMNLD